MEITERALSSAPAELLTQVVEYRSRGWGIALDDVGADPRSLALMPLLAPDVIKLDMAFVQQEMTRERARVVHAVSAEAERTGATILAEGIETEVQANYARTIGATLGQGWFYGRPGPLAPGPTTASIPRAKHDLGSILSTPFTHFWQQRDPRIGTKSDLQQMSLALEEQAHLQGESAVILSTFQEAKHFTRRTRERYRRLAEDVAFVGALAGGLEREPVPGVFGSTLESHEPLRNEWDVVVLGPHFAGAFAASDLGDDVEDGDRRFRFIVTHDRALVVAAARRLMHSIISTAA